MTICVAVMTKCDNNSITFLLLWDNHRNVHISLVWLARMSHLTARVLRAEKGWSSGSSD